MQLTLKAAVATHVLDVFTGWFTPSTGLARVLPIICQKSHNLVRLSDEYILCCDLDYENFDLDPVRVIKYNTRGPFYHHGLTLIPTWISNHMPRKVWAEISYPFPNFNGCTVEFWELITNFIPLFIMDPITHPGLHKVEIGLGTKFQYQFSAWFSRTFHTVSYTQNVNFKFQKL